MLALDGARVMLWVKIGTHVVDHPRFLSAGALARDLYEWGMLHAGISSPWGAGTKANAGIASRLVEVGLWERTEDGYRISRWAEQGNETKASLEEKRRAARDRKALHENKKVQRSEQRTNAFSSTSTSLSVSLPDLGSQIASEAPAWFPTALDVIEMMTGEKLAAGEAWLRYSGHRANSSKVMGQADAQYWLTSVMVKENKAAREERAKRRVSFGAKHVQSADNRAWKIPEGGDF